MTKLLVTGVNGQVGWELLRSCQPLGEVVGLTREECDLADPDSIRSAMRTHRPNVILNPAAYTAVDQAEKEEVLATRINGEAVGVLAEEAKSLGALLVHYSTDYVFDGTKDGAYLPSDKPNPQSAYGRSKLAGEQALQASKAGWVCLRTSWVFSSRGKNFLKTIIRLAQERDQLGVVSDQFGAPTSAELVAAITTHVVKNVLADKIETGIYHLTAAGETTWHGIARHILKRADSNGFSLKLKHDRIAAISTRDYPLPAVRPHNSVLDTTDLSQALNLHFPHWESDVSRIADELLGQLHAE